METKKSVGEGAEDVQSNENTLYDTITMDMCHQTLVQRPSCVRPNVNPNVNYGHWMIMMYQCRIISFSKCTTLVEVMHVWGQGYLGTLYSQLIFAVNVKLLKSILKRGARAQLKLTGQEVSEQCQW